MMPDTELFANLPGIAHRHIDPFIAAITGKAGLKGETLDVMPLLHQ
jgi:hypothetical protein